MFFGVSWESEMQVKKLKQIKGFVTKAEIVAHTGITYSRQNKAAAQLDIASVVIPGESLLQGFKVSDAIKIIKHFGYAEINLDGQKALAKNLIKV